MAVSSPIRVVLVDDDPLVRSAIRTILAATDDIRVVAEADDGDGAVPAIDSFAPDVVLMDVRMARVSGVAATERIRAREGAPEVLVLTTFDADEHVLGALHAGAGGFVLKDTPPAEIVEAVRRVARGEMTLSPAAARRLVDRVAQPGSRDRGRDARARLEALTDREREVADAVGEGASNADIAAALFMSVATVKAHVSSLLAKLELDNRVQVALLVQEARRD